MAALVIKKLLLWMPLLFGVGFIAPLTAQLLAAFDLSGPFGMSPLAFGLVFGGLWGLYAQITGRWL